MSSLRNALKSTQRVHKERHQPANRKHKGVLEKKKDYKLRAKHFHRKETLLKQLRQKALNKNPDEFYCHMINAQIEDGVHYEKPKFQEYTEAQLKLMQSQDINYVNMKWIAEAKKIEKLQSSLHLLDMEDRPRNKHIIFVDSAEEAKKDVSELLHTHPALLSRTYNRPRLELLQKTILPLHLDQEYVQTLSKERESRYRELDKRIGREKELSVVYKKMGLKKKLLNKKDPPMKKIQEGTKETAPVYVWRQERKR